MNFVPRDPSGNETPGSELSVSEIDKDEGEIADAVVEEGLQILTDTI